MANKIVRSVSISFYENGDHEIKMSGHWLRQHLDSIPVLMRRQVAESLAKQRVVTKEEKDG
jgi:hypothetical protein